MKVSYLHWNDFDICRTWHLSLFFDLEYYLRENIYLQIKIKSILSISCGTDLSCQNSLAAPSPLRPLSSAKWHGKRLVTKLSFFFFFLLTWSYYCRVRYYADWLSCKHCVEHCSLVILVRWLNQPTWFQGFIQPEAKKPFLSQLSLMSHVLMYVWNCGHWPVKWWLIQIELR